MATLTYNGITIGMIHTESVSFTPQFGEGGIYQWTKVDITVSGVVNPQVTSYDGAPADPFPMTGILPAQTIANIRAGLLQPQQGLIYDVAGEQMIVSPSPGFPCDPNNGPLPQSLQIHRIDGIKTIHVRYSVTTWIIECPGNGIIPTPLISNIFSQSHSINLQQQTVITTTGQALFREDVLEQAGVLADDYRTLLALPCPLGFQRTTFDVAVTPSRNAITYRYTDVQKMYDLGNTDPRLGFNAANSTTGSGVIDADITLTSSTTGINGGPVGYTLQQSMRINLIGTKDSNNWNMIQLAFALASSVLPLGANPAKGILKQISVFESMTDRKIGLQLEMTIFPTQVGKLTTLPLERIKHDPVFPDQKGLNPEFQNRFGTAGTYGNSLNVSAWTSLCQTPPQSQEGDYEGDTSPGQPSQNTGPIINVYPTDVLPDWQTDYSYPTTEAAYTKYEVNTSYPTMSGTIQCPMSSGGAGTAMSSGDGGYSGPDSVFVTVALPMCKQIVEVVAARVNEMPALPDVNQDPNLVLLDWNPAFKAPELLPDGQNYMIYNACRYIYGMKKAKQIGDDYYLGASPYTAQQSIANVFAGENFQDGIADGPPTDSGSNA